MYIISMQGTNELMSTCLLINTMHSTFCTVNFKFIDRGIIHAKLSYSVLRLIRLFH